MSPVDRITIQAKLQGARQYMADAYRAAAATAALGASADRAGASMHHANRRSFAYNQTIFTMRRYLYQATLALTALGVAAAYTGLKFNSTIERTVVSLDYLSKGTFNAAEQTKEFLRIARETAFLPQQVLEIGQSFIALGFAAEMANRTLRALGNFVTARNLPHEAVDRIVYAMGQVKAKGRLMGEEIRQFANAGIPIMEILNENFGTAITSLNRIGDARIPADRAIEAIVTSLESRYGDASKRLAATASFQWEQLKGDLQAIMGAATFSLFEHLGVNLEKITQVTGQMFEQVLDGNKSFYAMVQIVDDATGGTFHLMTAVRSLHEFLSATWGSIKLVLDVLKPFLIITLILAWGILKVLTFVQNLIQRIPYLSLVLKVLVGYLIAEWVTTRLVVLWHKKQLILQALLIKTTRRWTIATAIHTLFTKKDTAANVVNNLTSTQRMWNARRQIRINQGLIVAQTGVTASTWKMNIAAYASPWVWVALLIAAVIITLIVLEMKFQAVSRAIEWMTEKFKDLKGFLEKHKWMLDALNNFPGAAQVGAAGDLLGFISKHRGPNLLELLGGGRGVAEAAGLAMPKDDLSSAGLLAPDAIAGQSAIPAEFLNSGGLGQDIQVTVTPQPIILDGREIAEVVYNHRLDRVARR